MIPNVFIIISNQSPNQPATPLYRHQFMVELSSIVRYGKRYCASKFDMESDLLVLLLDLGFYPRLIRPRLYPPNDRSLLQTIHELPNILFSLILKRSVL
jgi:hypothetical protein